MNDAIETIAIGFTLTMIFGVPFAFFAFVRYLRYKETIALAERGLLRPTENKGGKGTLRWGIVLAFVGFALFVSLLTVGAFIENSDSTLLGPWILVGCLPMAFGLALITIYFVAGSDKSANETEPDDPIPPHKQ